MMDSTDKEPWSILAEKIIDALPEGVKEPLLANLEEHKSENIFNYEKDIERADPEEKTEQTSEAGMDFSSPTYDMETD